MIRNYVPYKKCGKKQRDSKRMCRTNPEAEHNREMKHNPSKFFVEVEVKAKYIYPNGLTARITRTSNYEDKYKKNFSSIEELMEFVQENGACVIAPPKPKAWGVEDPYYKEWEIEIYDDWRE